MTARVWNNAFNLLMQNEGGYVCHENDKGGATKYGISSAAYPNEDIVNMTLERARCLYKRDYWDRCKCDQLPDCLSVAVFDFAVNSGINRAIRILQKALEVRVDGIIGNQTIGAANRLNPRETLEKYIDLRTDFIMNIVRKKPDQQCFLRGWTKRIARTQKFCEELI